MSDETDAPPPETPAEPEELSALRERFADSLTAAIWEAGRNTMRLDATPAGLLELCRFLRDDPAWKCDFPADLCAYDTGQEFIVFYRLWSMERARTVTIHVALARENPALPSVFSVWPGVDWHERETFDLYGIVFAGHPNLERILLPEDWEGFPFRKDYEPVFAGDPLHGPQETN